MTKRIKPQDYLRAILVSLEAQLADITAKTEAAREDLRRAEERWKAEHPEDET